VKPIDLNLASRPYRNDGPLGVALALLAIAAIGLSVYNGYSYLTADTRKAQLEAQLAGHQARMAQMSQEAHEIKTQLEAIDQEVLAAQAHFVAGVLAQSNFSWTRLLNVLESVVPWNVQLSVIRPRFETGQVFLDLRGTALEVDAFHRFQEVLGTDEHFDQVIPGDYQYVNREDFSNDRIYFTLSCRYLPEIAEDEAAREPVEQQASGDGAVPAVEAAGGAEPEVIVVDEAGPEPAPATGAPDPSGRAGSRSFAATDPPPPAAADRREPADAGRAGPRGAERRAGRRARDREPEPRQPERRAGGATPAGASVPVGQVMQRMRAVEQRSAGEASAPAGGGAAPVVPAPARPDLNPGVEHRPKPPVERPPGAGEPSDTPPELIENPDGTASLPPPKTVPGKAPDGRRSRDGQEGGEQGSGQGGADGSGGQQGGGGEQ
jgi:Tfp pilus assembly protein PilN